MPTATHVPIHIGVGAGFAGDRYEPALDLITQAPLDALVFELLAERTIALAQRRKRTQSGPGYDERLLARLRPILLHALAKGTVIITNGGAADPRAAGVAVQKLACELGFPTCRIAVVTGDEISDRLDPAQYTVLETGESLRAYQERLISVNAYLGIEGLLVALAQGADVIITGRTADAALFLAPLVHGFGWLLRDWDRLAAGTVVGHLLECAGQLTGGYFADGLRKTVPNLAGLGFPYATVNADGTALFAKLPNSGGRLNRRTCLEQLLYEVDDPQAYLTPDVVVDFGQVQLTAVGPDQIRVQGAVGRPAPPTLKASVGIDDGFLASGAISYAGPGCVRRAQLAAAIVQERWATLYGRDATQLQVSFIGQTSCMPWQGLTMPATNEPAATEPPEVRLRIAGQSLEQQPALDLAHEIEALYTNGPAGGGGIETTVRPTVGILSILVARELVTPQVELLC